MPPFDQLHPLLCGALAAVCRRIRPDEDVAPLNVPEAPASSRAGASMQPVQNDPAADSSLWPSSDDSGCNLSAMCVGMHASSGQRLSMCYKDQVGDARRSTRTPWPPWPTRVKQTSPGYVSEPPASALPRRPQP